MERQQQRRGGARRQERGETEGLDKGRLPERPPAETSGDHKKPAADVYALVTERITTALEAGTIPWKKPWASLGGIPRNLASGRPYRGMNVLLLSLGQPYASPWWLTYKQAGELGGHIKKGERSSIVTFWKIAQKTEEAPEAESAGESPDRSGRRAPILRYYHVFNVEQCEGITAPPSDEFQPKAHERLALCEALVADMLRPPRIVRDPRQAFYAPALDQVAIPDLSQFETPESYYATLFHELTHATGHASRLARSTLGSPAPFGTTDYSREELVAEFGAAFLCAHAGIFPSTADNSAAYIDGWLRVLKRDNRMLPIAAAHAQKAADFILGLTVVPEVGQE